MSRRLLIDDGQSERELLVVGTMLVGRDPECEISSSDPRLSRRHAELRVTPTGVVVRDLGSRNGVRVNGTPVTEAVLAPGDLISVAHLSLRLVDDAAPIAASRRPTSGAIVVAAPEEDDRTRALPRVPLSGVRAGAPAAVAPGLVDDRTRVLPPGARPTASLSIPAAPTDVGEVVIRQAPVDAATASVMVGAADPSAASLAGVGWGRRVMLQGVLLALVVFLMAVIPLLAWQARAFGVSALAAWTVLLPTLGASVFAGAMVASLIARTAVRGVRRDGRF